MLKMQQTSFTGQQFNVVDSEKYNLAIKLLKESLFDGGATLFQADNLITWNRNYSFLLDEYFLELCRDDSISFTEKSIIWRTYLLIYFAKIASKAKGDFLEVGCHTGYTAGHVIKNINFEKLKKKFYLYDLFKKKKSDENIHFWAHETTDIYEHVKEKFSNFPFVSIVKGSVPRSFARAFPKKIAFAHLDMNHALPEAGALKKILPRLSKGAVVIFDDYGWWGYSEQKLAIDPIIAKHGLAVLELPTGQGLLINS